MENKKIKVLTLSDHPLSPSGVGTQTRYVCESLLESGRFSIISLGGAIKHNDYTPKAVEPYGEDWKVIPVDGYGTPEMVRSVIRNEKPDMVWIMTDPRFWGWLWAIDNEIRSLCPIVYYHVWDNYPYPMFNKKFYESNDHIISISRLTHDIVRNVSPDVPATYLPHAVNGDIFVPNSTAERKQLRMENLPEEDRDKFIVFWNNRNARRKQSGTLLWWWKEWLDERNLHDKAQLIMHTNPKDQHGQDLNHIIEHLGMTNRQVLFSTQKIPLEAMSTFYNLADVTINISDAEGFGLSTLESLSCGTPIIATMTGGLQEQVMSGTEQFGIPLFPVSKAIIGSQSVPYIYEDRLSADHVKSALSNMYDLSPQDRLEMGRKGRAHVLENYNFQKFKQRWVDLMLKIHEEQGSWETRKGYSSITFKDVA
jgi:glycosyltransferase involved in cell wall biosynthesis